MTLPGLEVEGRAAQIERAAAQWLDRVDSSGRPLDPAGLDRWLGESPRHRAAYVRLFVAWRHARALRSLAAEHPEPDVDLLEPARWKECDALEPAASGLEVERWRSTQTYRQRKGARASGEQDRVLRVARARPFAHAAVAMVVLVFGAIASWLVVHESTQTHVYSTHVGEFHRVTLEDGSAVALNTDTEVRVRYLPTSRRVDLVRGEALFSVAKNHLRPFDVHAGETTVRAVGTSFVVRLQEAANPVRVDVVVVEGRVAINPPSSRVYPAGTFATVENGRISLTHLDLDDLGSRIAWTTTGMLHFNGNTLEDVVAEMNRYNERKLVIASPELGRIRIGGSYKARDPDGFSNALKDKFGIRSRLMDEDSGAGTIVLEARKP